MQFIDSDLSLSLVDGNKMNSTFVKANDHILKKYADKFKTIPNGQKTDTLIKCWAEEFNATLDIGALSILFQRKKDMTMFLLMWG